MIKMVQLFRSESSARSLQDWNHVSHQKEGSRVRADQRKALHASSGKRLTGFKGLTAFKRLAGFGRIFREIRNFQR